MIYMPLSEQQKAACVVLNPEKSHPYIEDMAMFFYRHYRSMLEWHCVMCEQFFHGKKFCEACGTGIYCRAVCTKSVYSYQPDLFQGLWKCEHLIRNARSAQGVQSNSTNIFQC
ncbi:putative zinc ribbon protein [Escherichia coli]